MCFVTSQQVGVAVIREEFTKSRAVRGASTIARRPAAAYCDTSMVSGSVSCVGRNFYLNKNLSIYQNIIQ